MSHADQIAARAEPFTIMTDNWMFRNQKFSRNSDPFRLVLLITVGRVANQSGRWESAFLLRVVAASGQGSLVNPTVTYDIVRFTKTWLFSLYAGN